MECISQVPHWLRRVYGYAATVLSLPDTLSDLPDGFYLRLEGQTLDGRWFIFSK